VYFSIMRDFLFQVVPIVLILLVFYAVMRVLFFQPLLKIIAEREARTSGAQKEAEAAQAAAKEKVKQYQDALKKARGDVYAEQEATRKKMLDERATQLKEFRAAAGRVVEAAKKRIETDAAAARTEIEASITPLAAQVARRVLLSTRPPGSPPPPPSRPTA
jgi:F-type H+-transporting ATPase subunit b